MFSPPPYRNVEDVCRFPDLPARKQLTYQAKQLIAHEIEMEKMRRTEAVLQARNLNEVGKEGVGCWGGAAPAGPGLGCRWAVGSWIGLLRLEKSSEIIESNCE